MYIQSWNDTPPEIAQKQFEMMMALGPARRIELACEMYMAARQSILTSLPQGLSEAERKMAFLEKMYGKEFCDNFFEDGKDEI